MAEIRVEHKKRSNAWMWLLGLVLLALVLWAVLEMMDNNRQDGAGEVSAVELVVPAPALLRAA